MKRYILLVLSLFYVFAVCSAEESLSSGEIISASPATGQLHYEIPLYTIENPDFKWNIGITYISDGFRPYDYSFPMGSGWELLAGGHISREIIDIADDLDTVVNGCSSNVGFLTLARNPNFIPKCSSHFDIGSDIYSFSFGPYAGKFVFDSIGNARIISGDFVYIDVSDVVLQTNYSIWGDWLTNYQLQPSRFKITTLDGYNYYFGSTMSTASLEYGGLLVDEYTPSIIKWNLQRVEAPNGAALVFHYHTPNISFWQYDRLYQWRKVGDELSSTVDYILSDTLSMHLLSNRYFLDERNKVDQIYSYSILDSITSPQTGLTVSFAYTWLSNYIFKGCPSPSNIILNNTKPFLSSVQVKAGNQTLKSWAFNYAQINIDSTPHRYLSSVSNNCNDIYSFIYNFNGEIELDTDLTGVDIWGYDKNNPEFGSLISSTNPLGATNNYSYSWAYVDSIRIPEFYQGQWKTKTMNYQHLMCHAIKLSSIDVTNGTTLLFSKNYNYGEDDMGQLNSPPFPGLIWNNNHGSGVLSIEYGYYNESIDTFVFTPFQKLHASIFPITYGSVTETVLDSEGHISRSTTYKYQTDDFVYQGVASNEYSIFRQVREVWPYYQSHLWFRLLKSRTEKDAFGIIANQTIDDYSGPTTNSNLIKYNISMKQWNNIPSSKYFCSHRVEVHDQIYRSSSFVYDSKYRLTFQSQSQGSDTRFVRMVYPDNLSNNIPQGMVPMDSFYLSNMVLKNYQMIGEPIEQYGGYIENDIEYVTNGALVLRSIVLPQNQQEATMTIRTFALHPTAPITSYTPVHTGSCRVLYNANYESTSVARCQKWNRLVWEKSVSEALGTTYQWSSDLLFPISKTVGGRTWSYSYTPYVGITSEISPRGLYVGYQYDNCGRLEEKYIINNNQKEILEHYVYY